MAEPQVGMKFSSYREMTSELSKKYARKESTSNNGLDHQVTYYDKQNKVVARGRVDVFYDRRKSESYGDAYLSTPEGYSYSRKASGSEAYGVDSRFDIIEGLSSYAIDINKNGVVDAGEIFKKK